MGRYVAFDIVKRPIVINENFTENIYVVGSISQLANWSPSNAIALNANSYPTWSGKPPSDTPYTLLMNGDSYVNAPSGYDVPVQIHPEIQRCSHMGERPE